MTDSNTKRPKNQSYKSTSPKVVPLKPRKKRINTDPPQPPKTNQLPPIYRLFLVWLVLILGAVGLGINLVRRQVYQAPELKEKAQQQQLTKIRPFLPRRSILDRNGNLLATDRIAYSLFAHPKLFKTSVAEIAQQLSPIINEPLGDLLTELNKRPSGIRIAVQLTEEQANRIRKLKQDGLELIRQYARFYPQGELVADVLGYVDLDHNPQAGIELSHHRLLYRKVPEYEISKTADGDFRPDLLPLGSVKTDDLQLKLTIDTRLQKVARESLRRKMKEFQAKRGAVIVMDATDGSLLALVAEPTYNPNKFYKYNLSLFKNWVLSDLYEPGSTFKPINIAIALEEKVIQSTSHINDPGAVVVAGWTIKNADKQGHGSMSIAKVLQYSSNVAMVHIIRKMSPDIYYDWLEKIGLGQKVGVDLPFEGQGQIKSRPQFRSSAIEPATTSFGQGFSLTPIQLVQLQAALTNGGQLVTPHVVRGLYDANGKIKLAPPRQPPKQIFSATNAKAVIEMMETVVNQGTGKAAAIPGYRIGGKTGTAQKAGARGGYSTARITSFVGVFPIEAPRYVVLAVMDEPQGNAYGSTTAAPVVKEVMEAVIAIEKIPPSDPEARIKSLKTSE